MKKVFLAGIIITLSLNANAVVNREENATNNVDVLQSYGNGLKGVDARIKRRAELMNDVAMANLKIAAFEVEIAKEKLNKTIAEAAISNLEIDKK